MKNYLLPLLLMFAIVSCGDGSTSKPTTGSDSSVGDTGVTTTQSVPETTSSADTTAVQGKGTDRIPSRTGTTGQGNTTVTGSATGSPTGSGKKDSTKP